MDITIVIPSLNNNKKTSYSLSECLQSLWESAMNIPIIVATNGGIVEPLPLNTHNSVKRIHLWEQGQCRAVNAAIAATQTEWVLVSNDDMIYPKGWLNRLVGGLNNAECISPQLVEPRPGAPTFIVHFCGGAGGDFDKIKFLEFAKNHVGQGIRTGFNLPFLIKRELWDLVGGYDITYDPWGASSDTDLEAKIMLAGRQPYQNTASVVYHFSGTSDTFHPRNHGNWQKNYDYWREKWGYERPGEPDAWIAQNIIKKELLKYHPWWEGFYETKTS